jgi:hypothetical protein
MQIRRFALAALIPLLFNKRIFRLDMTSIVAGTKYRGQFEERIQALLHELEQNPDIIVFIDEIHTIIGASFIKFIICPGKRAFSPFFTEYVELNRSQLFPPFIICFFDFKSIHNCDFCFGILWWSEASRYWSNQNR